MAQQDLPRRGTVIRHQGHLYTITDLRTAQSGKQKPTVHLKMRALSDGHLVERTLEQLGGQVEEVAAEVRLMQYLYASGPDRVFMDVENYEQYSLKPAELGAAAEYLVEEETYRFLAVDGRPVALQLPPAVVLTVVETAPPAHAGGDSVYKEARVASGRIVRVPQFIKNGDRIRVSTDDGTYQGKEH